MAKVDIDHADSGGGSFSHTISSLDKDRQKPVMIK